MNGMLYWSSSKNETDIKEPSNKKFMLRQVDIQDGTTKIVYSSKFRMDALGAFVQLPAGMFLEFSIMIL